VSERPGAVKPLYDRERIVAANLTSAPAEIADSLDMMPSMNALMSPQPRAAVPATGVRL
jgi:hypothetical protein